MNRRFKEETSPERADLVVVHGVASLDPRYGGPSRSVTELADALARYGHVEVALCSQRLATELCPPPIMQETHGRAGCRVPSSSSRLSLALGLPLRKELRRITRCRRPDLLHAHGIWQATTHWMASLASAWNVPLVVHPRGMLEPWALSQQALKKRIALALFQRRDLGVAQALVASSEKEAENLRSFGIRQPIAVIPNGIDFRALEVQPAIAPCTRAPEDPRVVLYLSRLHPQKGLNNLIQAWSRVAPPGWVLHIAGPDEGSFWGELSREIKKLGVAPSVQYLGPLVGAERAAAYRAADIFVLPSFSESFGLVVAEALACGVPVIATRAAPWESLHTHDCGWWIDVGVESLVAALQSATLLTDGKRREMGTRGQAYVQRFQWRDVAQQTAALYRWLLGRQDRPACVRVD